MFYKISSITLNTGKKNTDIGDLHIAHPNKEKEDLMGKLFIVVEVESKKGYGLKIENFLINNISNYYYQNDNVILRKKLKNIKVDDVLQESLSKTNKDFINFLREEKIKISPYAINITAGVLYKNKLSFSSVGKNRNLIIYKKNDTSEYKITDIGQSQEKKIQTVSLLKLFSDISSGEIPKESYYFLSNEALSEFLSDKQIIEILTKLPPISAANHIENILSKINVRSSFLGIIIENTTREPNEEEQENETKQKEAFNIELAQKETEKILRPSGVINFRNIFSNINKLFNNVFSKLMPNKNISNITKETKLFKDNFLKEKMFFKKRDSFFSIKKITGKIKNFLIQTFFIVIGIFKIVTNKNSFINAFKKIKKQILSLIESIKNLNTINKFAVVIVPIMIIGFLSTTYFMSKKNEKVEKEKNIDITIAKIEKTQLKIEAKLLYKDEKDAIKLIDENQKQLKQLNNIIEDIKQNNQMTEYLKLKEKQEEQLAKVRHVEKMKNIKKIFDFKTINKNAKTNNLIFDKKYFYASDKTNSSVYQFEPQSKFFTTIKNKKINIKNFLSPIINNNNIFYFNDKKIILLNPQTRKLTEFKINLPENNKIIAMATFNNWLYLLDRNNKIHKYTRYGDKFKNRRIWLKQNVDFSNAIDLAIDGRLYVLKNNGSVEVYSQGKRQKFTLNGPINKLKSADKIIVTGESSKGLIYILEKDKNRLVVFDKNGKFVKQYESQYLKNADDIFIDENKNILYILNNNILYSYSMTK